MVASDLFEEDTKETGRNGMSVESVLRCALLFGAELEVSANIAEGLSAYGSFGYTESEIQEYEFDPNNEGNWAPYVARSTFNAGVQYRFEFTENWGLFARLDFERRGKQFGDPENSEVRDGLNLLALRLWVESNTEAWSLIA